MSFDTNNSIVNAEITRDAYECVIRLRDALIDKLNDHVDSPFTTALIDQTMDHSPKEADLKLLRIQQYYMRVLLRLKKDISYADKGVNVVQYDKEYHWYVIDNYDFNTYQWSIDKWDSVCIRTDAEIMFPKGKIPEQLEAILEKKMH